MMDLLNSQSSWRLLAAAAASLAALAVLAIWLVRRLSRPRNDMFAALGTTPKAAKARVAPAPVDLSRPIAEAEWAVIRRHAADKRFQEAVAAVRARYRIVSNPLLLPNTLKETMTRGGRSFREAVIRVAEDDGLHGHR